MTYRVTGLDPAPYKPLFGMSDEELAGRGIDVLYHDLDDRPGAKFAAMDLIGVPWQLMVGPRSLAEGKVELKRRADGSRELLAPAEVVERLTR